MPTMTEDRRDDSGRFQPEFTDTQFTAAIERLGGTAGTQDVADEVGCAYRTAHAKLRELESEGCVSSRKVGNALLWETSED